MAAKSEWLTFVPTIDPVRRSSRNEGCGEGGWYEGRDWYYRVGQRIPKNKVVALRWEGNFLGRCHGEVEHILVVWLDETNKDNKRIPAHFVVLEEVEQGRLKQRLARYKGQTPLQALATRLRELLEEARRREAMPHCSFCPNLLLILYDDQRPNECTDCYRERKKK